MHDGDSDRREMRKPLWEIFRGMLQDFLFQNPDWDIDRVAERLQCAPSTLRKYAEPPEEHNGSGRVVPTNRLMDFSEIARDDRAARWFIGRMKAMGLLQDVSMGDPHASYAGGTIEGVDFSGQDLRGASFEGARLFHCNLSAARLGGANFSGAYLLDGCNLFRAKLSDANFKNAYIDNAGFQEADLRATDWRGARISRSSFRDCTHTGADMRNVVFVDTEWFADRYRGGLALDGADLSGLKGISESHGVLKQIVLNIADGRQSFQAFAGFTEIKIAGCWQTGLHFLHSQFEDSERREILDAFRACPQWLIGIRLEFEVWKRERLISHWGEDWSRWPKRSRERDAPLVGDKCAVAGIEGVVSKAGLFKPLNIGSDERYDTMDVTTDEMLAMAMAKRKVV